MAYVRDPFQTKKGQSGVIAPGTPGSGAGAQQGQTPTSNWTNLQDYVKGNQGQGEAMAQKMTSNAANAANDFTSSKTALENAATSAIDKGKQAGGWWNKDAKTIDLKGLTADDKQAYNSYMKGPGYTGPTSADQIGYSEPQPTAKAGESYQTPFTSFKGAGQKARAEINRFGSMEGQQGIAADTLGKGNSNYTGGMSMLDTILANQAGGAGTLEKYTGTNAANKIADIQGSEASTEQSLNQKFKAAQTEADAQKEAVRKALEDRYASEMDIESLKALEDLGAGSGKSAERQKAMADFWAQQAETQAYNQEAGAKNAAEMAKVEAAKQQAEQAQADRDSRSTKPIISDNVKKAITPVGEPTPKTPYDEKILNPIEEAINAPITYGEGVGKRMGTWTKKRNRKIP